ncbi:MAG: DUF433 domain-containing protein [Rhizomicrobium sp.]
MDERIEVDPRIMVGKPVIKGTRITVDHVARLTAAGMSIDEIIGGHPRLTREAIVAAQHYAAAGHYLGPAPEFAEMLRRARLEGDHAAWQVFPL